MSFNTADLCDQFPAEIEVCDPLFRDLGGRTHFAGRIATIKCFEDNSLVRQLVSERGDGRVLVIDAGGSLRRAVLGDLLAQQAVDNGWSGVLVYGCIRDSAEIGRMALGVKALATHPMKTDKRGEGQRDIAVRFGGVTFRPNEWLYADPDGVIVAARALS
jgi:regulator of ribonuclease activity A